MSGFNPFAGLKDAQVFEKGAYLKDGVYDVQIAKCVWKKTRSKGDAYIVEMLVLASNNDEIKAGEKRTWYQGMRDTSIGFSALKEFIYAVVGIKDWTREQKRVAELEEKVSDPANPGQKISQIELLALQSVEQGAFDGTKLRLQVTSKLTKEGKTFSLHKWEPMPDPA